MINNDIVQKFENKLKIQGNKQTTIDRKMFQLQFFLKWLDNKKIDITEIHTEDIECYLNEKTYCRGAQVQNLQVIKALLDLYIEMEIIFDNPVSKVEIKKGSVQHHYEVPSYEEIQEISRRIQSTDSLITLRDFSMFELAYGSGARVGEIITLNIGVVKILTLRYIKSLDKSRKNPAHNSGC